MKAELPIFYKKEGNIKKVIIDNPYKISLIFTLIFFWILTPIATYFTDTFGDLSIIARIIYALIFLLIVSFLIYFFYTPKIILSRNMKSGKITINHRDYFGIRRNYNANINSNPIIFGQKKIPQAVTPLEGFKRRYRLFFKFKENGSEKTVYLAPHRPYLIYVDILSGNKIFDMKKDEIEKIAKFLGIKNEYGEIGESADFIKFLNE